MKQTREKTSKTIVARLRFIRTKIADLHKEEGVTLIELLAVVVILGIIAIIAIPTITNAVAKSKLNSTMTTEATIQTALERYVTDHGQYPTTLGQLAQQTFGDGVKYVSTGSSDTSGGPYGPYLTTALPQNDGWGNLINYAPLSNKADDSTNGATITGYILLSGDGTAITFDTGTTTNPKSVNGFVYAAGGTDLNNLAVGCSPSVTDSSHLLPSSAPNLISEVNKVSTNGGGGVYNALPTFVTN